MVHFGPLLVECLIYRISFGFKSTKHKAHSTIKLRLLFKKTFAKRRNHVRQTFGNISWGSGDTLVQSHWCAECHHWEQGKELWSPSVPVSTAIRIFKSANTKSILANEEMTQMRQAASKSLTPLCPSACLYHINLSMHSVYANPPLISTFSSRRNPAREKSFLHKASFY